jgi:hypothetical protein
MTYHEQPEHDDQGTSTDERRRNDRRRTRGVVHMSVETTNLTGAADNVSHSGILFFTDEALRVRLEIVQNGETRTVEGRLVRGQRMRDDHFGWAVEFDPN